MQFRRDIAKLKRQLREYQRKIAFLEEQERKRIGKPEPTNGADADGRFSARSATVGIRLVDRLLQEHVNCSEKIRAEYEWLKRFRDRCILSASNGYSTSFVYQQRPKFADDTNERALRSHHGSHIFVGRGRFITQRLGPTIVVPDAVHLARELSS